MQGSLKMSYIPDGVTEYDTQPDPLNQNRASLIRFAAACPYG